MNTSWQVCFLPLQMTIAIWLFVCLLEGLNSGLGPHETGEAHRQPCVNCQGRMVSICLCFALQAGSASAAHQVAPWVPH